MASGSAITTLNARVAVTEEASFTCTVKLNVPKADGLPLNVPVVGSSDVPAGRAPALTDQAKGPIPPVAPNTCEYEAFSVPLGRAVVVMLGAGATVRLNAFVAVAEALSVTFTVKVEGPTAVGEPEMALGRGIE